MGIHWQISINFEINEFLLKPFKEVLLTVYFGFFVKTRFLQKDPPKTFKYSRFEKQLDDSLQFIQQIVNRTTTYN